MENILDRYIYIYEKNISKAMLIYIKQRRSQRLLVHLKALQTVMEIRRSSDFHKVYAGTLMTSACTFVTLKIMPSEGSHCKVVLFSLFIFTID